MNIALIGSEEAKFTPQTKRLAIQHMTKTIAMLASVPVIVSGHCHLGGVDIWAEELADSLKIPTLIFPPEVRTWDGGDQIGFKQRNIQIAQAADLVVVVVVSSLPPGYPPEAHRKPCYHCANRRQVPPLDGAEGYTVRHVKSGACYAAWHAVEQCHKKARWIVI